MRLLMCMNGAQGGLSRIRSTSRSAQALRRASPLRRFAASIRRFKRGSSRLTPDGTGASAEQRHEERRGVAVVGRPAEDRQVERLAGDRRSRAGIGREVLHLEVDAELLQVEGDDLGLSDEMRRGPRVEDELARLEPCFRVPAPRCHGVLRRRGDRCSPPVRGRAAASGRCACRRGSRRCVQRGPVDREVDRLLERDLARPPERRPAVVEGVGPGTERWADEEPPAGAVDPVLLRQAAPGVPRSGRLAAEIDPVFLERE